MLAATPEEKQAIIDYMNGQAPDLKVEFLQKVYVENVLSHHAASRRFTEAPPRPSSRRGTSQAGRQN